MNARTYLAIPFAIAATLLVSGCPDMSGGGGSPAALYLSDGDYLTSNGNVDDDCALGISDTDVEGNTLTVSTNGSSVIIDFGNGPVTLARDGDVFSDQTSSSDVSLNTKQPCTVDVLDAAQGTITANDEFDFQEEITLSDPQGAGCAEITAVTFPCTTTVGFHAALL